MRHPISDQKYSKQRSRIIGALALALSIVLMMALPAVAAEEVDDVIINGYELGFFEQMALEDHIDRDIADGNYWFELDTGMWGPVGEPAIGRIDIPEDYREYVETRLKPAQAARVEYSAPVENCETGCLYW